MAKRPRTGPTFIQRSRAVSPERKAIFHDVTGAGRSRVLRPFFRLTSRDEDWIMRELEQRLDRRLSALR